MRSGYMVYSATPSGTDRGEMAYPFVQSMYRIVKIFVFAFNRAEVSKE